MSPIVELGAGIGLAAGAIYFVLRPIFTPLRDAAVEMDGVDPEDDLSPRAVALRALKEIEFDRATGKLADADYDALKAKYTAEALVALREDDAAGATGPRSPEPKPAARSSTRSCPTHGPRPEGEAAFCSECGRRLTRGAAYCSRCGTELESEARFCSACGRVVAA